MDSDALKIGQLGKPHGVRGEINFTFTTDVWDRAEVDYLMITVDGIMVPFFLEEYRFRGEHSALLKFLDLDSIEAVQEFCGAEVYVEQQQIDGVALWSDSDDVPWQYFKGFRIVDETFGELGEIADVDESTENVLFDVKTSDGMQLIPAVEAFVKDIDHEARLIHMQLPEGLLEL